MHEGELSATLFARRHNTCASRVYIMADRDPQELQRTNRKLLAAMSDLAAFLANVSKATHQYLKQSAEDVKQTSGDSEDRDSMRCGHCRRPVDSDARTSVTSDGERGAPSDWDRPRQTSLARARSRSPLARARVVTRGGSGLILLRDGSSDEHRNRLDHSADSDAGHDADTESDDLLGGFSPQLIDRTGGGASAALPREATESDVGDGGHADKWGFPRPRQDGRCGCGGAWREAMSDAIKRRHIHTKRHSRWVQRLGDG